MERLSIQGDFFDSQLYGGRLYLWTFNGSLRVYDYSAIINRWLTLLDLCAHRCGAYESRESVCCISDIELQKYLIYERSFLTEEFPVGTEFFSDRLYEANARGLFSCSVPYFKELKPPQRIWDAPLISVNGSRQRGLICSAGSDGVFWLPSIHGDRRMMQLSTHQSIMSTFCDPGVYVQTSNGEPFLLKRENGIYKRVLREKDLFFKGKDDYSFNNAPRMTWTWKNLFFLAKDHSLKVFEYVEEDQPLRIKGQIQFFYWKGEFVSAGSCDMGTVLELDNAICIFEGWDCEDGHCTLIGPVTRWRLFPRSKSYNSHVHVIFNDRIDIVALHNVIRIEK